MLTKPLSLTWVCMATMGHELCAQNFDRNAGFRSHLPDLARQITGLWQGGLGGRSPPKQGGCRGGRSPPLQGQ